jgi:hypothetical protein
MPGQALIDEFVMKNEFAYIAGQTAAGIYTAFCGGCGAAMWTMYYTELSTGSTTAAVKVGAITYASSQAGNLAGKYFGGGTNSLGGRVAGGAINGYLQTGDTEGALRGAAAGLIPQDLGLTNAYLNSAAANIAIGVARDGIRGYIVDGEDGIVRGIAIGQFNNAVGHVVGFVSSGFSGPEFFRGAFIYQQSEAVHGGKQQGITIGNVMSVNDPCGPDCRTTILPHEFAHIPQGERFGKAYLPIHGIAMGISLIATGGRTTHSRYNLLECSPDHISIAAPGHCR